MSLVSWYQHMIVAWLLPPLAVLLASWPAWSLPTVSGAILVAFVGRELRDKYRKDEWTLEWKRDMAGDLLGPVTAFLCYLSFYLTAI